MGLKNEYFHGGPVAFNAVMNAWAYSVPDEIHEVVFQKLALDALAKLTLKTPVKTGRARGNWQVTIGSPSYSYDESKTDSSGGEANQDPGLTFENASGGGAVISEGSATIMNAPDYSIIWISNNVPYIMVLEEGSSSQAPTGMLANTMNELEVVFT